MFVRKYHYDEFFFRKIDTEDKAWVLGWFFSDGNVQKNRIRLGINDLEVLEKIRDRFKFNGPFHIRKESKEHRKTYILYISSRILASDLTKLGCPPNKTFLLKFPTEEMVPRHLIPAFIRGEFEGDGCCYYNKINKNYTVSICGTRHLLEGINNFCGTHGIFSQRHPERNKDNLDLRIFRREDVKTFLDLIYKDANFYMQRKFDKYYDFLKLYHEREKYHQRAEINKKLRNKSKYLEMAVA